MTTETQSVLRDKKELRDRLECYVINLDEKKDRMERMTTELQRFSFPFTRVSAVKGADIMTMPPPEYDSLGFRHRLRREILPGELGCYLSHLNTIRLFLASDKEFALICEDDICFCEDFESVLSDFLDHAACWNYVRLFCISKFYLPFGKAGCGRRMVSPIQGLGSAACYLLDRKGAERLLKVLLPIQWPYDTAINHGWWGVKEVAMYPLPITLHEQSFTSSIQINYLFKRPVIYRITGAYFRLTTRLFRYSAQLLRWLRNLFVFRLKK